MTKEDWQHRVGLLRAWEKVRADHIGGSIHCAVKDGCAVTIRALSDALDVKYNFEKKVISEHDSIRDLDLWGCHHGSGIKLVIDLYLAESEHKRWRDFAEVMYLANRAIAHPKDGKGLNHRVQNDQLTSAINTVLGWIKTKAQNTSFSHELSALFSDRPDLFEPIN